MPLGKIQISNNTQMTYPSLNSNTFLKEPLIFITPPLRPLQIEVQRHGQSYTIGENNIILRYSRGPTNWLSDPGSILDGPDHRGGGRPNNVGVRPTSLVPNTTPSSENGNIEYDELTRAQLPHESHVQEYLLLPNNSLPLWDRNLNFIPWNFLEETNTNSNL